MTGQELTMKGAKMALKALILDVDGTLAETADVKRAAFNQAFAEIGIDWIWGRAVFQQIHVSAAPGNEANFYARLRHPELALKLSRNGALGRIQSRQQDIYRGLLEAGAAQLRPGIARLLAEAVTGRVKLALCSTGPRQDFEMLLFNQFGHEMVDALAASVSAEDVPTRSLMHAYQLCLKRLGITAQQALVIDDSGPGCAAAARLGLTVIATPGRYTITDRFADAHLVISDLGHPAAPFSVKRGDAAGQSYVTLDALRQWHQHAIPAALTAA